MSDVFQLVKSNITTKEVVMHYGMHPNQSNLICCPFHHDKHPSMKVDKRFFCFGCGESGDVIDFVKLYFDLPVKDAAQKIADDFGLLTTDEEQLFEKPSFRKRPSKELLKERNNNSSEYPIKEITKAFRTVADYFNILRQWKVIYAPKSINEEWNEHFIEALDQWTRSEYFMDGLLFGSKEEINGFYECYKGEVEKIGRRVTEIEASRNQRRAHVKR